jgi:hypothetical protein
MLLPTRRDNPGYCTAGYGHLGGAYEVPCIFNGIELLSLIKGEEYAGWLAFSFSDSLRRVGLERGPLSLVSTTKELLGRKVAASV